MNQKLYTIRNYQEEDRNFILSSWLNGLYHGNSFYNLMDRKSYFENYEIFLKKILENPETIIRIAAMSEDPSVIFGYAVLKDKHTVHYLHTKHIWRRIGIMRELLKPFEIKSVTHLTELGFDLMPGHVKFDPFKI